MKSNETRVPVLYRNAESGKIETHKASYAGPVPVSTWRNIHHKTLTLNAKGYFYPCDTMDVYHLVIYHVITTADRIVRGEIDVKNASPSTYLTKVAYGKMYECIRDIVRPMRDMYRSTEGKLQGQGTTGEDSFDEANYDPSNSGPSAKMLCATNSASPATDKGPTGWTAQQLAENLPDGPSARTRRDRAAAELETIFTRLTMAYGHRAEPIITVFRAYVAADGDFRIAARLLKCHTATFYRNWSRFLAITKNVILL